MKNTELLSAYSPKNVLIGLLYQEEKGHWSENAYDTWVSHLATQMGVLAGSPVIFLYAWRYVALHFANITE